MAGAVAEKPQSRSEKRDLVRTAAARLRELILAHEPGSQIGSLNEVSDLLGVGIVTVQQAARVLEHEGLLEVRRGPGGGYYGARPDDAALERALATYLRVHCSARGEAREIVTLMDCELAPAAAHCNSEELRAELRALGGRLSSCATPESRVEWEQQLRAHLFRMVNRPLFELISRVAIRVYDGSDLTPVYEGDAGIAAWQLEHSRIIAAILTGDHDLARSESLRHRHEFLRRIGHSERVAANDGNNPCS